MKNKQIKKLRSYTEKYKVIIGLVVVVVAVFLASTSQLQTGFLASESGFTVPFPDSEAKIGENSSLELIWSNNSTLSDLGYEYYEIFINLNGEGFEYVYGDAVSGNSVTYTVEGADYGPKNTVVVRLLLYIPVDDGTNSVETEYDIIWDDVTVLILEDPDIYDPEPTTPTDPDGPGGIPPDDALTSQELFIYILYGVGGLMSAMVIGAIFVRKRRG